MTRKDVIKIAVWVVCSICFLIVFAFADQYNDARVLFFQGNSFYASGDFDQAIAAYEKALAKGVESGPLYYNLGNSYFKKGILGKAILNYYRAQQRMPVDPDIKSNLHYAQSLIQGGYALWQKNIIVRMIEGMSEIFTLDGITLVIVFLYWMCFLSLVIFLLARKKQRSRTYAFLISFTALVFVSIIGAVKFYQNEIEKKAIVVMSGVQGKFEPLENATTFFDVREGEAVVMMSQKGSWVKVKRFDGKQGWIKKEAMELIQGAL